MIDLGAAFLLQVGDNVDVEDDRYNGRPEVRTMPIKGELVQPLYDAGIGFFTLRGNHESSQTAGAMARAAAEGSMPCAAKDPTIPARISPLPPRAMPGLPVRFI